MLSSATVTLKLAEKKSIRPDIDCQGDTISYNCSVLPNSENGILIWTLTLPEQTPISITYDSMSNLDRLNYLIMNVITMLTEYRMNEYIESILTLTISQNYFLNGSRVECGISTTTSESTQVVINALGILYLLMHGI